MKTKRRGGCCIYLIIILVVVVLVPIAWVVTVHSGLLEKLGLRQPVAERLFALPLDRKAADTLMGMLKQGGTDMQGVSIHVLPMAGRDGSVAILTLDASQGLDTERFFGGDGGGMGDVFDPDTLQDLNITRLAFDYVDDRGNSIATLTIPTEVLQRGDDMDEKEFLRAVMGRVDIPGLVREVTK